MLPDLRKNSNPMHLTSFRESFVGLREQLISQHYDHVERGYIRMSMAYFLLADSYDIYPSLFLVTIGHAIEEAKESMHKNDLMHVSYEMEEVREFVDSYDEVLSEHGISDEKIESFILTAYRIKRASVKGDTLTIEREMKQLEGLYAFFMERY